MLTLKQQKRKGNETLNLYHRKKREIRARER